MQRSLMIFSESIKSEYTKKSYLYYLSKFKAFYSLDDYDSMVAMEPKKTQIMVEDYVMDLKKRVSPNTLPTMIFGIKAFFDANDVDLNWKKIIRLFPEKIKRSGFKAWTVPQIQKMLKNTTEKRVMTLILFLASSGVRIGAIPDMKIGHLKRVDLGCYEVTVYAGTKDEYITFLTPEASGALDEYFEKRRRDGEQLDESSPIFRARYKFGTEKVRAANKAMLQEVTRRIAYKAAVRDTKEGKRYDTQIDTGFRKFFNLTLKTTRDLNPNYAEKMMGHSSTIPLDDHYLPPNTEAYFAEYKKAIQSLTIDDSERQETRIKQLESEKTENQQITDQLESLAAQIYELKHGPEARESFFDRIVIDAKRKDERAKVVTAHLCFCVFQC